MVSITASNATIEKEIRALVNLLKDAGGGFHSKMLIHEEGGGLSIKTTERMADGKELLRLPRTVLIPDDQYALDIVGNDFVVSYPQNSIANDTLRRIIDKNFEVYNVTNKIKLHKEFSFFLSLEKSPLIIEKLGEGRNFLVGPYVDWFRMIKSGMTDQERKTLVCKTYLKTRPLGYSDPVRESATSMIMPILDYMNHHWTGALYMVHGNSLRKGDLVMNTSQPFEDSTECFSNYAIMDAFDSLLRYDFIDESAPIVRSVALDIEGPAGDEIRINNQMAFLFKGELKQEMRDLRRHIPNITVQDGKTNASHLFIPTDNSRLAMVRALNLILAVYNKHHSKTMTEEEIRLWMIKVQEKVVEKNMKYYEELLGLIDTLPLEEKESFGVKRISDLALHQIRKIKNYEICY